MNGQISRIAPTTTRAIVAPSPPAPANFTAAMTSKASPAIPMKTVAASGQGTEASRALTDRRLLAGAFMPQSWRNSSGNRPVLGNVPDSSGEPAVSGHRYRALVRLVTGGGSAWGLPIVWPNGGR